MIIVQVTHVNMEVAKKKMAAIFVLAKMGGAGKIAMTSLMIARLNHVNTGGVSLVKTENVLIKTTNAFAIADGVGKTVIKAPTFATHIGSTTERRGRKPSTLARPKDRS